MVPYLCTSVSPSSELSHVAFLSCWLVYTFPSMSVEIEPLNGDPHRSMILERSFLLLFLPASMHARHQKKATSLFPMMASTMAPFKPDESSRMAETVRWLWRTMKVSFVTCQSPPRSTRLTHSVDGPVHRCLHLRQQPFPLLPTPSLP